MGQNSLRTEKAALELLSKAEKAGALSLVDEDAQPLALLDALDTRCWARLTDVTDGKVYVDELRGSRVLTESRYLELLGIDV